MRQTGWRKRPESAGKPPVSCRRSTHTNTPARGTMQRISCQGPGRSSSTPRALKARWVFPLVRAPLAGGVVTMAQGRIVELGSRAPAGVEVEELGNVALLPGLVNAHVHLEFSSLDEPLGKPGVGFVEWLRLVIERFRSQQIERSGAVACGLEESRAAGVGLLGEIAQSDWPAGLFDCAALKAVVFLEMIGPEPARAEAVLQAARQHISRGRTAGNWNPGLSPHAPYTVLPELLDQAVSLSVEHRLPLAMHLAESEAELEFLRTGGGPLARLLDQRGVARPAQMRLGPRVADYLRLLSKAHRLLVVHGNYLCAEEIEYLAGQGARAAVVYCPRTHAHFGHAAYPLAKMLASGLEVALGTDSRASAPDLDMLAEMRFAAWRHPEIPPQAVLRMATFAGAKALGLGDRLGAIAPGYWADLCAVALPEHQAADPHELLLDRRLPLVARWFRGRREQEHGQEHEQPG